ncbi:MAG TPA: aminotransferase class III-fold pyridoxal phosphate-dependent enzyme, partial [Bryobacteraceae bacterium]
MTTIQPPVSLARPRQITLPQCTHQPRAYTGPSKDQVHTLRETYLSPALFHLYDQPLMLVEGHMQYVWDETGKRYLDSYAGIVAISAGHCHPKITAKTQAQLSALTHTSILYYHPTAAIYAQKLAEHFPKNSNLSQTYFTNSGSEANEVAFLAAREFTGNHEIISLRNGYHGGTTAAMAATGTGVWKYKSNLATGHKFATPGYCYRCPFGLTYPSCDVRCARDTEDLIRFETSGQIAAFIADPIQGIGGVIAPPKEYFQIQYDIVRTHGGICIADEVQTGFGRTGEHFWGFQNWGVTPDIVTMAKGIGNGCPLAAVVTTHKIAQSLMGKIHFNTFGGNPVVSAAGTAVLEVIEKEKLQENALKIGNHI